MKQELPSFSDRISTTNWFYFISGILITLVISLGFYAYIGVDEDVSLKDIIPSIVTGVVSLAALLFSYSNNSKQQEIQERQQDVQIKTTIEKEWVEKVRTYLAEIIDYYIQGHTIIEIVEDDNRNKPLDKQEDYKERKDFREKLSNLRKNRILLDLHLNFNEPLEKELNGVTEKLWYKLLKNKDRNMATLDFQEIQRIAHILFEQKLKGS